MFNTFKLAVQRQFNLMNQTEIFEVDLDKDQLWELYLSSFPEGTNPIYKERTEHDCNCCKQFIRNIGNIVTIKDDKLISIWDVHVDNFYQEVANALSNFVKSHAIKNLYFHFERNVGTDKNNQLLENGEIITWEHFYIQLPKELYDSNPGAKLSNLRSTYNVMLRGLEEITIEAIDTVLDLINQNSLYRGEEHKGSIEKFRKLKIEFQGASDKSLFCWANINNQAARIRNSVIGTLLVDVSEDKDLESAVKAFEVKVAPANYKRPTAVVTKAMIEKAKEKVNELGLMSSLNRRFAVLEDITVNNVLFANRDARKRMENVFDEVASQTSSNQRSYDKVEEIQIGDFVKNVLPNISSMEILFENRHSNNLVSLVAPCDMTSKNMFKWDNPFSWSYVGEMTDSIKERVKNAGGNVTGDLRCSLSWFNFDDLDLHMVEPNGTRIMFNNRRSYITQGNLDVDMNAGSGQTRNAVENICYPDRRKMVEGIYRLIVHNFTKRESCDVGFEVEIEFDGNIYNFVHGDPVPDKREVVVAEIEYTHKDGFKVVKSIPSTQASKNMWNLPTQTFHKVSVMCLSPNHWDDKVVGNKHYFFMLDGCLNDGKARGFFNEFLSGELNEHRKVLELIGSKMKTDESENQLSGLGFSSTKRDNVLCKVSGNFSRTLKLLF